MPISKIPGAGLETTGTASVNTFLRGDNAWAGTITSGTAQASTSGTSIDFTGIPATAKRITVMFNGVSTNGTSNLLLRLGDSGGIETTGYNSHSGFIQSSAVGSDVSTAGFILIGGLAADVASGSITFVSFGSNTWIASGVFFRDSATDYTFIASGAKTLSDTLDRLRITTVNGTDTFDAGTINIMWES